MDFNGKGIAWVRNICQKIETLFVEVDCLVSEEIVNYVENQFRTVGANVKQFCSNFVHDVLPSLLDSMKGEVPDLSLEENKITELAAYEISEECVDKDSKKGLCNINSLPHPSFVEHVEGEHIDSSLEQNTEIGKGNPVEEKCSSEIPELVAHADNDSSIVLSCCGVHQSNQEEKWDGQIKLLPPTSFQGCNSSIEEGTSCNIVNTTTDISTALTLTSSVLSVESFECEVPDEVPESGLTSVGDVLSAVSSGTEEDDDHVIEPGMETFQPCNGLKLEDSCDFVDSNEIRSIPLKAAIGQSYKKKIQQAVSSKLKLTRKQDRDQQVSLYEHLDAGQNQQRRESSTPIVKLESPDHDFCESEWEII